MSSHKDEDDAHITISRLRQKNNILIFILVMILLFYLWNLLGIFAVMHALSCATKSGSITAKITGIFTALMFGPFFWLYYQKTQDYC